MTERRRLTGWGCTAPSVADVADLDPDRAGDDLRNAGPRGVLVRGLGRSYGDAGQNGGGLVLDGTEHAGLLDLDIADAVATAAAGTSLDALMRQLLPLGWFVPVTPGTRHVTVGGAIASDIHGKNHHHDGTFGAAVTGLRLATVEGVRHLAPDTTPAEFWATAGGMGLTGPILDATFRLRRVETASMVVDTDRAADLDTCMAILAEADERAPYSVAWIDCVATGRSLGRSVITTGRHARLDEVPARRRAIAGAFAPPERLVAPPAPPGLLNRWTVAAFNELWFRKSPRRRRDELQSIAAFFHPLDGVQHWNRLYGPRGFLQHQCLVPFGEDEVLRRIIERLAESGAASFLAVLKRFGEANPGHLSFPSRGWTLALDLPVAGDGLHALLDEIDEVVLGCGGRIYLAKDSRARAEVVHQMYPRLDEWREVRAGLDPEGRMQSDLARRLRLLG